MGGTGDLRILLGVEGHNADNVPGAGIHAGAAGDTFVEIYLRHIVHNMDGIKLTGLHAVSAAQAAIGTLQRAGGHPGDRQTAFQAHIIIAGLVMAAAGAHHLGNLARALFHLHAHDGADLFGHFRAAGGTGIHRSQPFHHSVRIAAAAGIAAAAAVGAGETLCNGLLTGVLLHGEDLGGNRQDNTKDNTQHA